METQSKTQNAVDTARLSEIMGSEWPGDLNAIAEIITAYNGGLRHSVNYPVCFHTVDAAIVRRDPGTRVVTHVLLVQKHAEVATDLWRFPGGFMDPRETAEHAVVREVKEETGMIVREDSTKYIGSSVVPDPRMKDGPHSITTSFFVVDWQSGDAGQGFDDVAKTKWVDVEELNLGMINPIHHGLIDLFDVYCASYIAYTKMMAEAGQYLGDVSSTIATLI